MSARGGTRDADGNLERFYSAMKAEAIPAGEAGLWLVRKVIFTNGTFGVHEREYVETPPGQYTILRRYTDSTLHLMGEVVMEDTPHELKTHIGFVLRAFGNVLVTGLGLGCVVRGLLENPRVEHITCIENSRDVLKLVASHMPAERLTIIEADALKWTKRNKQPFDCAWHDLWTDEDNGEPHLNIWHAQLLANCKNRVKHQGAWAFNRDGKALLIHKGFSWIG